ncbi:uncharacterized protein LOC120067481 [Benincasa hispida]|uniref:uncharacterized protein LOC120067481 n=1 Tax=Benincasa hispida TaxID=102211 RepID=UPI0018FF845C|nr:uncharacterized protein LOC120067481 [Benincasa hispida]
MSSGGGELQSLSLFNSSPLGFAVMDGAAAVIEPSFSPAISTGYLEDALVEYTSKRRRLDHHLFQFEFPQSCWSALEGYDWNNQIDDMNNNNNYYYYHNYDAVSTEEGISSSSKSRMSEETSMDMMKTQEVDTYSTPNYYYEHYDPNSSSSSNSSKLHKVEAEAEFLADKESIFSISRNLPISTGFFFFFHPFALVKPGGIEGDMTLNDINQKILMPPTRPVRHPVGDFACRPCVSADGPGLSGKAVVALTKIHTQGRRGTITIIRTKG